MTQVMVHWMTEQGIHEGHRLTILLLLGAESEEVLWFYSQLVSFYTLVFRYAIGEFNLTMPVARDILRGLVRLASPHLQPPPSLQPLPLHPTQCPCLHLFLQYTIDVQEHIIHCVREHKREMESWFAYLQQELTAWIERANSQVVAGQEVGEEEYAQAEENLVLKLSTQGIGFIDLELIARHTQEGEDFLHPDQHDALQMRSFRLMFLKVRLTPPTMCC